MGRVDVCWVSTFQAAGYRKIIHRKFETWICLLNTYQGLWVCLKIVYPIVPNGFADHYPY